MKVNELEYQSSYILTSNVYDDILNNYRKTQMGKINIYYDNHTDILIQDFNGKSILLLGYCFDIRNGDKDQEQILNELLTTNELHYELDYINGRYIFIIKNEINQYFFYSDASQLRPLVYHQPSKTLASHDSLLSELLLKSGYKVTKRDYKKHNEFDYTRFVEIFKFNPSLYLSYNEFKFVRFYPREELEKKSSKDVFNELKTYLDESIKYLEKSKRDIFVTITGGIDSRVSAALTRDFSNNIHYLTYTQQKNKLATRMAKKIYEIDEQITNEMKEYLGWNHKIINLENYSLSKKEFELNNAKYNSKHSYSLSKYYRTVCKYHKALHVKSTVFGMGKADFPKELDFPEDTIDFYKKCIHGLPKDFDMKSYEEVTLEYFKRNKIVNESSKGRHYFDLYHLESRMGNWHSMLTLETDPETEEFIFTNSRKLIDLIQQPSIEEKRNFELYKIIIEYYWPVLLKFGINKPTEKKDDIKHQNDAIEHKEVSIIPLEKMNIHYEENYLEVIPDTYLVSVYDHYSFSLKNQTDIIKKLKIKSYYKNIKAKGKIFVIVRDGKNIKKYDILDLNEAVDLHIGTNQIVVTILYAKNFMKNSWVKAGRMSIEISDY